MIWIGAMIVRSTCGPWAHVWLHHISTSLETSPSPLSSFMIHSGTSHLSRLSPFPDPNRDTLAVRTRHVAPSCCKHALSHLPLSPPSHASRSWRASVASHRRPTPLLQSPKALVWVRWCKDLTNLRTTWQSSTHLKTTRRTGTLA